MISQNAENVMPKFLLADTLCFVETNLDFAKSNDWLNLLILWMTNHLEKISFVTQFSLDMLWIYIGVLMYA